jgi:hypothetical protein
MIDQQDRDALVAAATKAMKAMGQVPAFEVAVEDQDGAYARVKVSDKSGKLTPLYGFAVRKGGSWDVVSFGTFFEPEFYSQHKIPAGLQLT